MLVLYDRADGLFTVDYLAVFATENCYAAYVGIVVCAGFHDMESRADRDASDCCFVDAINRNRFLNRIRFQGQAANVRKRNRKGVFTFID